MLNSKKLVVILGYLGLFMVAVGVSWGVFTYLGKGEGPGEALDLSGLEKERAKITEMPKTEVCPINGAMYTEVERKIWEGRRPMTVVIENHADARPQSGLSRADVVYEAVAEGGITRFLAVFYCGVSAENLRISPIRSARVYFVNWAAGYNEPLFVHYGGANNICNDCPGGVKPRGDLAPEVDAFGLLSKLGWRHRYGNDLDGGTNAGAPAIQRDQYRLSDEPAAWEHSVVGFTDLLFELGQERGYGAESEDGELWKDGFYVWSFADDSPVNQPEYDSVSFGFWSDKGDYDVEWRYHKDTNSYLRFNGGKAHTDWEFDESQIAAKNVVIQFVKEKGPVDRELHMYYEVIDEGEALIFQNGTVIEGTWEKEAREERTVYYGEDGEEINFVRGGIWVEAVPIGNDIVY